MTKTEINRITGMRLTHLEISSTKAEYAVKQAPQHQLIIL